MVFFCQEDRIMRLNCILYKMDCNQWIMWYKHQFKFCLLLQWWNKEIYVEDFHIQPFQLTRNVKKKYRIDCECKFKWIDSIFHSNFKVSWIYCTCATRMMNISCFQSVFLIWLGQVASPSVFIFRFI